MVSQGSGAGAGRFPDDTAMMYEEGNGVEKDPEEAKRLYAEAGF